MSRNSIKAVDQFIRVLRWNDILKNAYDVEDRTQKRDRELAKFRKLMAKVHPGRIPGGYSPMKDRHKQWKRMVAAAATKAAD